MYIILYRTWQQRRADVDDNGNVYVGGGEPVPIPRYSTLHVDLSLNLCVCWLVLFVSLQNTINIDDMIERNSVNVTLHDVDPTALRQLIEYTYTGEITITEDNVQVFYKLNSFSMRFLLYIFNFFFFVFFFEEKASRL